MATPNDVVNALPTQSLLLPGEKSLLLMAVRTYMGRGTLKNEDFLTLNNAMNKLIEMPVEVAPLKLK